VLVSGKGDKERRVPLDPDVAGLVQSYLLAGRPETASRALFVVAKGPHRGQPLTAAGLRRVFRYHREISGVAAGHPHALRHSFGTALAEAGVDLPVLQALMGHDHVDSSAAYIHLAPAHVRAAYDACPGTAARLAGGPLMPPVKTVVPPQAAPIYDACLACLAGRGVGNKTFDSGARCFLARFPDPQAWADLPLAARLAGTRPHLQPLLNFLMLHGHLRPGYDYLLERKLTVILREAAASPLGPDVSRFPGGAEALGYAVRARTGMASEIAVRVLIQTGRALAELTDADFAALGAGAPD
jgi:Phage integrase family